MVHSAEDGSIPVLDMSALIVRLEAAEAGSRELDAAISDELDPIANQHDGYPGRWPFAEGSPLSLRTPAVTTSLEAALALAERVLPGWAWGVSNVPGLISDGILYQPDGLGGFSTSVRVGHKTPALALCLAILRAIQHGYEAAGEVSPNLKAKAQGEGG